MKINFTQEHFQRMQNLLVSMLINDETITNRIGQPLNVVELLHTTSINGLNGIRLSLMKQIENLENQDEWVASSTTQYNLDKLKASKELVNLIIGYKRYKMEVEEVSKKKAELIVKLTQMKEEAKTPEDRIKEIETELAALDNSEFK